MNPSKRRLTVTIDKDLEARLREEFHKACEEALTNARDPPSFSSWFNDWLKAKLLIADSEP